jgi:hypothetical protein
MNIINRSLKNKTLHVLFVFYLICLNTLMAQDVTTITANDEDISDNLDLEAVASIFGDSKDLEDFEKRLNDPKLQISNLDLNNDGEVDYLRVMETAENNVHTISIQAVIGKDQYQEVATIDVQKDSKGETQVQVVGNVDMYGPNYYITPVYPVVPVFFTFFFIAAYNPWHSPWYWGHHPPYFRPWHVYPAHRYRANVNVHISTRNSYNRTNVRINNNTRPSTRDNAYFRNNPNKSFDKRNPGVSNRQELINRRGKTNRKDYKSTGRPVQKPSTRPSNKPSTRPSQNPSTRPSNKPSTRPSQKPNTRPSNKPSTQPSQNPSTRPSNKPPTRPSQKPSARPSNKPSARPSSRPPSNYNYSRKPPSRSSYRRTRH